MNVEVMVFVGVVGVGLLFLVLREFVCWYWKVNQTVALLTQLVEESKRTNRILKQEPEPAATTPVTDY